ncbi:translation initiation factor 2 subunit beta [Catovirus CTV1]|uniref:Translation initiation factor 2 subunit beta n=1 Tax=Catovirus CTV1 TaxID=1977631 RepID=A0A1V0SB13_9VIRU|nr:translation initiation factor 2 subunit beta [Catovirus CTV1]
MINIRGTKTSIDNDVFFRYKMHSPKISDQKNTKTLENLNEISKDLDRDSKLIIKFLKNKLGVNIVHKNDKLIIPKTVTYEALLNAIYDFIQELVLCPKCQLPETVLVENNVTCKCCSYSGKIK